MVLVFNKLDLVLSGEATELEWMQKQADCKSANVAMLSKACLLYLLEDSLGGMIRNHTEACRLGATVYPFLVKCKQMLSSCPHNEKSSPHIPYVSSYCSWLLSVCLLGALGVERNESKAIRCASSCCRDLLSSGILVC